MSAPGIKNVFASPGLLVNDTTLVAFKIIKEAFRTDLGPIFPNIAGRLLVDSRGTANYSRLAIAGHLTLRLAATMNDLNDVNRLKGG
jgi:hypothetical protein